MSLKSYIKILGIPGVISAAALLAAWTAISLLLNDNLKASVIFAIFAFLLDCLDGYVARLMKKTSEIGRQLDSMVDLVAYSIYAALLTSQVLLPNVGGIVVGYVIVLFGILRLIRFNVDGYVDTHSNRYYRGVVVCHLSLITISFLLISTFVQIPSIVMVATLIALSILQLSNIKTRKTGVLPFWFGVALVIGTGAVVWLP